jgi:colanic acid biosynthesis glycosyl transferase WcaI
MHVLFLSHYFPPEVNAPATRTFEHCRRWVEAGHKVTVITCAPNCPHGRVYPGYRNRWRSEETVNGVRVLRVWTHLAPNKGFARRILNYLTYLFSATLRAARVSDVDVIVATSPQFFCGWAGVLVKWLKRKPFILEIRDLWPDSILAVGAMRHTHLIQVLEWLERRMYRAAKHIVTVGNDYRRGLVEKGVPWNRISVVPNGVDLATFRFDGDRDEVRQGFGLEGKFVCGYIGTVGMAHGLEVMLNAAEMAKKSGKHDLLFWIVGDGARRTELQAEAKRRGLNNVVFGGLLPKELMPAVISACDACLVHLRGAELFSTVLPSKIFEAMALEVPIICGVRGQAQDIVCESGAGMAMTPDVAEELLDRIEIIQSAGRDSFGAKDYLARHFDRDQLAAELLQLVKLHAGVKELDTTQELEFKKLQRAA